jgi:hypothetical protein
VGEAFVDALAQFILALLAGGGLGGVVCLLLFALRIEEAVCHEIPLNHLLSPMNNSITVSQARQIYAKSIAPK